MASVEWLPGDEKIGYVGRHFDADGNITEYGLCTAVVNCDPGTGAPIGIVGQPTQVIDYLANGKATDEFPGFSPDPSEVAIVHVVDNFPQSMRIYSVTSGLMIREFAVGGRNDLMVDFGGLHGGPATLTKGCKSKQRIVLGHVDRTQKRPLAKLHSSPPTDERKSKLLSADATISVQLRRRG